MQGTSSIARDDGTEAWPGLVCFWLLARHTAAAADHVEMNAALLADVEERTISKLGSLQSFQAVKKCHPHHCGLDHLCWDLENGIRYPISCRTRKTVLQHHIGSYEGDIPHTGRQLAIHTPVSTRRTYSKRNPLPRICAAVTVDSICGWNVLDVIRPPFMGTVILKQ